MTKQMGAVRYVFFTTLLAALFFGCKEEPTGNEMRHPDPPRNVKAAPVYTSGAPQVLFQWDAPLDSSGITGYRIWWYEQPQGSVDSTDVDASQRSAIISGLAIAKGYLFVIVARRGSFFSKEIPLSWSGFPPLPATDLDVTVDMQSTAHLTWHAPSDPGITGYRIIWRRSPRGDSGLVDVAANLTSKDIAGIDREKSYDFELRSQRGSLLSEPLVKRWTGIPATPPAPPSAPAFLNATSLSGTSVGLSWTPSNDTGLITYRVRWTAQNIDDTGSVETGASSVVVNNLKNTLYVFSLVAIRKGALSTPITLEWAPAARYGATQSLRMYENSSSNGSGLTLDPSLGGPRNAPLNMEPRSSVQLAIYNESGNNDMFWIGPASSFSEFRFVDEYDHNVFVSDSSYLTSSLDTWMPGGPIAGRIPSNGNIRAFQFPAAQASGLGQGFYVRTGMPGNYHYARIFVRNVNGKLFQGTSPNRYVELEISYQLTPNLPYAKRAGGSAPANVASRPRR